MPLIEKLAAHATAADVAQYILQKTDSGMSQLKLQKLLYYCQAGSLAWTGRPMFDERIEAWANGPVVVSFWDDHRYEGWISRSPDPVNLRDDEAQRIIDQIYRFFGDLSPEELSERTHHEGPWLEARRHFKSGDRGNVEITAESMHEFYAAAWNRPSVR